MQKNIAESIRGSNYNHLDYVASYQPTQLIFLKTNSLLFDCFFCSPNNKSIKLNTIPVKIFIINLWRV